MKDYSRFIDEKFAYREMKTLLEDRLGRELTPTEDSNILWLSDCDYETVGILFDIFKELGGCNNG